MGYELVTAGTAATVIAAELAVIAALHTAWEKRDIRPWRSWTATSLVSLAATAVWLLLFAHGTSAPYAWLSAPLIFVGTLSALTDATSRKIPRDITPLTMVMFLPLTMWPAGALQGALITLLIPVALLVVNFVASTLGRRFIGGGDIRMLTAAVPTLLWWVIADYILIALAVACAVQLAVTYNRRRKAPADAVKDNQVAFAPTLLAAFIAAGTATMLTW